jgi:hypothetical protein
MLPLSLPLVGVAMLGAFIALPRIINNPNLAASFGLATAGCAAWLIALVWRGRPVTLAVSIRPQHWVQAIAHSAIFVYWSFYWDPIRDAASLIAAQIVFAYTFDMLLSWSRGHKYVLGFGPFPIIYSTNLFLRFRDDWFYLQFAMVAIGFLAKELIKWERDGKRVHIFNPSSFPLALFSLGLIVTGTTRISWGEEIATLLILPPHIYLFIFLIALPGQLMFRVTSMTLPAVLTTYLFSLAYLKITGTYYFFDSDIPISVFLGMHLLFTDPSTAPRTELGRVIFGIIYGASVVFLYGLLGALGAPTFYDKLLQVPFMNLSVRAIDRFVEAGALNWLNPARLGRRLVPIRRSLVWVSLWILAFGGMTSAKALGDFHPGHTVPFWYQACEENRDNACHNLGILYSNSCREGSGWACNELGNLSASGRVRAAPPDQLFRRACALNYTPACRNAKETSYSAATLVRGDPAPEDYVYLLRQGKGPLPPMSAVQLFDRACSEHWPAACGDLAAVYFQGREAPQDRVRAHALFERACEKGHARSCSNVGLMYRLGDGVPQDPGKGLVRLGRACDLGMADACKWLAQQNTGKPQENR